MRRIESHDEIDLQALSSALFQFLQNVSLAHDPALAVAHENDGVVSASFLIQEFLQLVRNERIEGRLLDAGFVVKKIDIETGESGPLFIDSLKEIEVRSPRRPPTAPNSMHKNSQGVVERMA